MITRKVLISSTSIWSSWSWRSVETSQYKKESARKSIAKAHRVYRTVSLVSIDHPAAGAGGAFSLRPGGVSMSVGGEMARRFASSLLQNVAHATNGVDQLAGIGIIDFSSQPPHRHNNDGRFAVEVHVSHLLGNQGA